MQANCYELLNPLSQEFRNSDALEMDRIIRWTVKTQNKTKKPNFVIKSLESNLKILCLKHSQSNWQNDSRCIRRCQVCTYETGIFVHKIHVHCMKMIKNILSQILVAMHFTHLSDNGWTACQAHRSSRHFPTFS